MGCSPPRPDLCQYDRNRHKEGVSHEQADPVDQTHGSGRGWWPDISVDLRVRSPQSLRANEKGDNQPEIKNRTV